MTEALAARLTAALADRYRIERQVGQGGMATVYLAHDLRHGRKVALKVLRPELAAVIGADRFLQEIRVTAALQHPHILPLHDSGEAQSFLYYVMPFVDGESLRHRLERERQLPIDDAIRITTEASSALAYAHGRGVIHRDIKPENILLSHGAAVVADFGIARAVSEAGGGRLTESGLSLGTPQYMSPEQATADRELDGRSDVYALGAVLYEMLTGEPPFTGPTTQSVIAKLLTENPRPVLAGRPTVPFGLSTAVHKALARLPADRFRDAREFAEALARLAGAAVTEPAGVTVPAPLAPMRFAIPVLAGVAAVAVAVAAWSLLNRPAPPVAPLMRTTLRLPDDARASTFSGGSPVAMSADGQLVVYSTSTQLYLRRLDQLAPVPIPGTHNAVQPFLSPDGQHVGFAAGGSLRRMALAGGSATTLCPVGAFAGASWGRDGPNESIVFSSDGKLFQIGAGGGTPRAVPVPDTTLIYHWPELLPDGRRALATVSSASSVAREYRTAVVDLETGETTPIPGTAFSARLVEPGALISFDANGTGLLTPFDVREGRASGATTPVLEGIRTGLLGSSKVAVSRNGWAVYLPAASTERRLALVDRRGLATILPSEPMTFSDPRFSPSGRQIVVTSIRLGGGLAGNLWLYDLEQRTLSRLSFGDQEQFSDWTADGRVTFVNMTSQHGMFTIPAGGGEPSPLMEGPGGPVFEGQISRNGRTIVYRRGGIPGDLYYMKTDSIGTPHPLVVTPYDERSPAISPNDRWVAYVSNETGRDEVYVRPLGPGRARWLVSTAGGSEPRWGQDGRELFYRNADSVLAVSVRIDSQFSAGPRTLLFTGRFLSNKRHATYDVHPDGRQFVFISGDPEDAAELVLVQNLLQGRADARNR